MQVEVRVTGVVQRARDGDFGLAPLAKAVIWSLTINPNFRRQKVRKDKTKCGKMEPKPQTLYLHDDFESTYNLCASDAFGCLS